MNEQSDHERDSRRADSLLEMIARDEKADHELDIRRADERSEHWQMVQQLEKIERSLRLDRCKAQYRKATSELYWHEWGRIQEANRRRMLNLPEPERNEHVAQPFAAILNQFGA